MRCLVRRCGRTKITHPNVSFHRFPSDARLRARWIEFCGVREGWMATKSMRICSVHFDESAFLYVKNIKTLRNDRAVPTKPEFLLDEEPDVESIYPASLSHALPLYSCPSLVDHTYADFRSNCEDCLNADVVKNSDVPEPIELTSPDSARNRSKSSNFDDSGVNFDNVEEPIELTDNGSIAAQGQIPSSSGDCNIESVRKLSNNRKSVMKWKRLAMKWKKEAFLWKSKFSALEKKVEEAKKLNDKFRSDQLSMVTGKVKQVKKWSDETVTEGLRLRFACGAGYEQLLKLPYVALPCSRTLVRKIQDIHFDTGFLHEVLEVLKSKTAPMSCKELDCGIILDEMSLDEANEFCPNNQKHFGRTTMPPSGNLATHGLVFMIVGIYSRWKQVIGYEFTGNSIPSDLLKEAVDKIITNVESIGLKVRFVTSDCGASNKGMWKKYGVSTKKETALDNWATVHPIDENRTLEFIPDPVHLFKSIVNGWISNKFFKVPTWYTELRNLSSNIVSREHLTLLVVEEANQSTKLVYRLQPEEVDFEALKISNVDKMKVSSSTRYCSHTVAAAMHIIADQTSNSDLKTTAAFIEDLSKWYELMTSRSTDSSLDPKKQDKYAADIDHLNMMIKLVADLKVGVEGHWKPWQSTTAMATAAILRLQETLLKEGYDVVMTSVFDQDCLESLFGVIRLKQRRPTPLQFKNHLRTIAISQYMQPIKNSSYDMDDQEYLTGFMEYLNSQKKNQAQSDMMNEIENVNPTNAPDLSESDVTAVAEVYLNTKNNSEANAMYHVAGYIMGSISRTSSTCSSCIGQCVSSEPFDRKYGKYSELLATARQKPFVFVTRPVFEFFVCMEELTNNYFESNPQLTKQDILTLQKTLKTLPLRVPSCHNLKLKIVKRFVRFKATSNRSKKTRKRKYDSRSMLN